MTNHNYNTPAAGTTNWHEPLNENFQRLDADVEMRDVAANRSEYEPKKNAKFLATDTGVVYVGVDVGQDVEDIQWVRQGVLPQGDGFANEVLSEFAVVAGGLDNRASGPRSAILGGKSNLASGRASVAMGKRARAVHDGAVVIGDSSSSTISSRATGEVRSQMPIHAPAFYTTSARAKKSDIAPVDPQDALAGVESLSIRSWELDGPDAGRHVGPMAEDFDDQFDLGDDGAIATVDADGIALAAIQGLADRLETKDERIDDLEAELAARDDRVEELETRVDAKDERIAALEDRLAALESAVDGADRS